MTLYEVRNGRDGNGRRSEIRSWWVHLTVALVATAAALLVLILNGIAEREMMPRMVQNAFAVAAVGAWTLCYIRRAEARIAEAMREDRIDRDERTAALGMMIADLRRAQSDLRKVIAEGQRQDGFAEGWLARSGETPEVEQPGMTTVRLKAVP